MQSQDILSLRAGSPASAFEPIIIAPDGSGLGLGYSFDVQTSNQDATANTLDIGFDLPTGTKIVPTSASPTGGLTKNTSVYVISLGKGIIQLAASLQNAFGYDATTGLAASVTPISISSPAVTTFKINGTADQIVGLNIHDVDPKECGQPFAINTFTSRYNVILQIPVAPANALKDTLYIARAGSPVYSDDDVSYFDLVSATRLMGYLAHDVQNEDKAAVSYQTVAVIKV
jgi:hypothetical protein